MPMDYEVEVMHTANKDNGAADALSRLVSAVETGEKQAQVPEGQGEDEKNGSAEASSSASEHHEVLSQVHGSIADHPPYPPRGTRRRSRSSGSLAQPGGA